MSEPSHRHRPARRSMRARLIAWIARAGRLAAFRRALLARLPFLVLRSDVVDVVYLTWLVPVAQARKHVPASVALWQRHGLTPFSVLTYRHRHFGPALAGPLRKGFGSPLQSNWRFYLQDPPTGAQSVATVLFTHNVLDSLLYVLGARVLSDALPADLPARFVHQRSGRDYTTEIEPCDRHGPCLSAHVRCTGEGALPPAFGDVFGTWQGAVDFLALQEAAVTEVQGTGRLAHAQITLPIDTAQVLAAEPVQVVCTTADALGPVGEPLCFVVPGVAFSVCSERLLPPAVATEGMG